MQLPVQFGKYELLERIATGGMAELFLARSFGVAGFEKHLVIKRIRPELAQDPRFVSLFVNEARIGVHLAHPNVVHIYDLGRVGSSWYIAMEHLHGRDLTRLVKTLRAQGVRLPMPVAVAIAAEICRGLAYAHALTDGSGRRLGLVHQDVSPHNVLVTFAGEVKLVDFGIARLENTAQARAEGRTPGRPGGGKYAYMSPEQALGGRIDHRTDVFSTGIVLWELLVGHRLYDDPDPSEKLRKVQQAVIPHPRDEGVPVDEALWATLRRALAPDVDARYPDAAQFEEDLRSWLVSAGHHAGRREIAAAMERAFPGAAARVPAQPDLARLLADVDRLDPREETRTVPPPVARPRGRARSEGEHKTVTVLLVDVDGLTALSERVEPEILFKRHYQLLRWLRRVVDRYGGCVQRAVDDQVVVLFGVPRTQADDLERALECALDLQRSVAALATGDPPVALAIGVHTGDVTVTTERRPVRYVARGDTTRLARRLSGLADHGQVLVSERVLERAQITHRFAQGPPLANRGGRAAVASYALVGRRSGLRMPRAGAWIWRGPELEEIRQALVGLGEGHGRAVLFLGEHGFGKSQLLQEIRDLASRRGLAMHVARCLPFGDDAPLEPFRVLAREVLGLDPDAPRPSFSEQLDRLAKLGLPSSEADALVPLLAPPAGSVAPEALGTAVAALARGAAANGPVILALDDVHHLRRVGAELVRHAVRACADRPLLFLCTAREPLPPGLRGLGTEVGLGGLDVDAQRRLLRRVLQVDEVDAALEALVARSCEGNPLYVAELVQYLLRRGDLTVADGAARLREVSDGAALPDNLVGLLSARIDELDPVPRDVLQIAAVIGPTFSATLLARAAGMEDPADVMDDLAAHGLVHRVAEGADLWAFGSELVREAVLRGILGARRRDHHRRIASAIQALPPEGVENGPELLAFHCAEGGRWIEAARSAWQVGQALERARSLERAKRWYDRGLGWLERAEATPQTWDARTQGEAMLQLQYGNVCLQLGDTRTGGRALQLALDVASDAGLPWIEIRAHLALARSCLTAGRQDLARAHVDQARALLRIEPDDEAEREAQETASQLTGTPRKDDGAVRT